MHGGTQLDGLMGGRGKAGGCCEVPEREEKMDLSEGRTRKPGRQLRREGGRGAEYEELRRKRNVGRRKEVVEVGRVFFIRGRDERRRRGALRAEWAGEEKMD